MKRRKLVFNFILFIGGCTTGISQNNHNSNKSLIYSSEKLKFAVADATGIEDLQRNYGAFRSTLEAVLGIAIEFFPVENRTAAAPALQSGQVDIVLAGPSEYVVLSSRAKAIPLLAIQRLNYYPIIVVRADSKIQSLAQLKGKTIAMRTTGSTSGHLAPIKMLIDAGLDPNTDVKILMLGDEGIEALRKGKVDAWTIASDRYNTALKSGGLSEKEFSVIAKGALLPSDLFVINNQFAPSFIEDVRSRMLKHQDKLLKSLLVATVNQPYQGSKLIPINDAEYNIIREVYQKIGQGNFI
ncbi:MULTISPECIES: phosphate/phosphite/phosphonate ABC transporter substrate-binding protein [unclassified Nodularia (in: cyanobacteria)]|uniref:phosphate/phosphite/phosphonate ABC transporter substrate-binding protein n=1 Tax=unclassified Nodularia (in: cyanobacteria) TaxID=2656917 RepID=UPI001880937F|nr:MULTISPECIES: phosphate/phosphite/phosphonate ABC transporter substrate-binding protein [unclassified Nodularia (in: cyanobacteria)]MBE9198606.1 phosphate/phosphite/phosphonate ABC transporter substrate-binding protein [Nodularia sp. LEGE 06071]MCC2691825.1 phosphate/phosphite/phosphonate ABC transporter substrate-binding protein [Nodularia sp. LEGE 04288]